MISVRDLSFTHPGRAVPSLRGVSVTLQPGDFLSLMGKNGSGKSTLARCINGLLPSPPHAITVDGLTVGDRSTSIDVRRRVGIVFQNPHTQLTSPTVEREIAFGLQNLNVDPGTIREKVEELLELFGLQELRARTPSLLSAGEQQRVALAAVLVMEPHYLILDEPTSYLSPVHRTHLMAALQELIRTRGIGVLLITQFPQETLLARELMILHDGSITDRGEPGPLMRRLAASRDGRVRIPLHMAMGLP